MSSLVSIKELKNMPLEDLLREVKEQSAVIAKLRLGIKMNKEKDSAKYKREKKQLARMKTVLNEKEGVSNVNDKTKSGIRNPESGIRKSSPKKS